MVRVCRVVPKEWAKATAIGSVIPRTRFIVFKAPLNDRLLTRVDKAERFNVTHLLREIAGRGQHLGLVVDLTDTDRYYDKKDIEGMCINYEKINCPGRGFLDNEDHVEAFNSAIQHYIDECQDPDALIGVHCTDGVNRSGYLICRFLIERLGWSSHEALDAFERARGHPIASGSYVQALHKAAVKTRERANDSDSDSEVRRKKKKKSKRKREEEYDQLEDMKNFIGQIEQTAQELESGSVGYASPSINGAGTGSYHDSPAQTHWAYAKKQKMTPAAPANVSASSTAVEEQDELIEELNEDEEFEEDEQTLTKSQKRRIRKNRTSNMLHIMRRGNFHEIQEMQEEYMKSHGAKG